MVGAYTTRKCASAAHITLILQEEPLARCWSPRSAALLSSLFNALIIIVLCAGVLRCDNVESSLVKGGEGGGMEARWGQV